MNFYPNSVSDGFCFAAGTLVHTKEGLRPIETIRVGDWVLSRPEDGSGAVEYKRVTQTFRSENKDVGIVEVISEIKDDYYLIATPSHLFWVKGKGWVRTDHLNGTYYDETSRVESFNGDTPMVYAAPLFKTTEPKIGWYKNIGYTEKGSNVDMTHGVSDDTNLVAEGFTYNEINWQEPGNEFRCTVYNLEVEDFHTYFVGTCGVWVHNACPKALENILLVSHGQAMRSSKWKC